MPLIDGILRLVEHSERELKSAMKAAVLHELGRVPRFEEFSEPAAGAGEAIVRVRAASLKPIDKQLAAGTHFAGVDPGFAELGDAGAEDADVAECQETFCCLSRAIAY